MERLRSAIKLRQLEYFLAAAKTLNFSKAAASLSISQPALSQQIADLEAEVGVRLFHRKGRLMSLSQAGELYSTYAARAFAELDAGRLALDELVGMKRGHLRIGASQSFVHKMLPPILGEFMAAYEDIRIHVAEMTAGEIEKGLADGVVDVGIAFAPAILEDTEIEPLLEERLVLVMRASQPFASRESVRLAELHQQRLVVFSDNYSTRHLIERFLRMADATPIIACETNSIGVMRGIAANSNVMAIIPEGAVGADNELAVVPLVDPTPIRVSALLWSRTGFRTHAARAFSTLVRERFPTLLPFSQVSAWSQKAGDSRLGAN